MLNRVILMGRLVSDPELKTTPSGVSVTTFRVAVDRNYVKQGEERVSSFDKNRKLPKGGFPSTASAAASAASAAAKSAAASRPASAAPAPASAAAKEAAPAASAATPKAAASAALATASAAASQP